jgi:hypothetical protein
MSDSIKGRKGTIFFSMAGWFFIIFWRLAVFCVLLPAELN